MTHQTSIFPVLGSNTVIDLASDSLDVCNKTLSQETDNSAMDKNEKAKPTATNMPLKYTHAHGRKIMWNTDVNLGPPNVGIDNVTAHRLMDMYHSLQYALYETRCPQTVDWTSSVRPSDPGHGVAIAILSVPRECIGLLLEGGEQCPDGMHLILSKSWLSKKPSADKTGLYSLYIHKAITFHKGGVTSLDEFRDPRKVTYFLNYMPEEGEGNIEKNLDCPMSTSIPLCKIVDNKVWTRSVLIGADVEVPVSLNFLYRCQPLPLIDDPRFSVYWLNDKPTREDVHKHVKEFLSQPFVSSKRVVVKPSGPECFQCVGVTFHDKEEIADITDAVMALFTDLQPECAVLIETFVEPIQPRKSDLLLWAAKPNQTSRVRATICRDHDNVPVTTLVRLDICPISCGTASKFVPVFGGNLVPESFDTNLRSYGIEDRAEREELEAEIRNKSELVMSAMIEFADSLPLDRKGEYYSQIEIIGIDYFLTEIDGKVRPVAIEINGHDCTINCQVYDFLANLHNFSPICANILSSFLPEEKAPSLSRYNNGPVRGRSVRPFVRTMVARSQLHTLKGKKILVIGSGGYCKRNLWPKASSLGIGIVLVDSAESVARYQVDKFIPLDFSDHKADTVHAKDITNLLLKEDIHIDGCQTFVDDCVPLAAIVAEGLGLTGSPVSEVYTAIQTPQALRTLRKCDGPIPHWPRAWMYATDVESMRLTSELTTDRGIDISSSNYNDEDLKNKATDIEMRDAVIFDKLEASDDIQGIESDFESTLALANLTDGSKHDVDIIIYNRQLIGSFISDIGPSYKTSTAETVTTMPSTLPSDKQVQLVAAAYQCCTETGLSDGVFNVEMRMTACGPKLVRINARMGDFYTREWIRHLYGVDLMVIACEVACGIEPIVPVIQPRERLMGVMLLPSKHRQLWLEKDTRQTLQDKQDKGEIIITMFRDDLEDESENMEQPFANIAVKGNSVENAGRKLLSLCEDYKISKDSYEVSDFIKYF